MEDLITIQQAATAFSKHPVTIRMVLKKGKVKRYEVGKIIYLSRTELGDYFLTSRKQKSGNRKKGTFADRLIAIQDWVALVREHKLGIVSEDHFLRYCWSVGLNAGSKREDLDMAFEKWKAGNYVKD
jgi:hypothetical protein